MRVDFTPSSIALLSELDLGDPVVLRGYVVEIREPRVDIRSIGGTEPRTLPAEREFVVQVESVRSMA